ncbi:hypothetical protein [Mesorhizobium sp. M0040]|uniref:hypothetical protein n=1 Tax=Mesorhizobium sp. M0040 TaxID=2956855 RepID=UPI00333CEB43
MAITEKEAGLLISTMLGAIPEEALRPGRLSIADLISQWRAEIEAGRPVDRKLTVRQSPGLDEVAGVPRTRTSSTGEFVGKKEYSKVEQLDLLVEALGLAFIAPQMMASRFLDTIERFSSTKQDAESVSVSLAAAGGAAEPSLRVDWATIAESTEATMPLAHLLNELSQEDGLRKRAFTELRVAI